MNASLSAEELRNVWPILSPEERVEAFAKLDRDTAEDFFQELSSRAQSQILLATPEKHRAWWLRLLAPDDVADVLQELSPENRAGLLELLDPSARREVRALLAYAEDEAGGLMSPRFVRVRPEMSVDEAVRYVRRQARERVETVYYVYVLDSEQRLLGVVSFRELLVAPAERSVSDLMETDVVTVAENDDQEHVARVVARTDLLAVPVVNEAGQMRGIVTVDDVVDVVQQQATEDMQKLGGMQALTIPYLQTGLLSMLRKRAGWLAVLFVGEMLTASAMAHYETEIARAIVLTLFVPLILSSGGNAGSQATTLVIRAMSLGEVRLRDWSRILRREAVTGLALGAVLGIIGVLRVAAWEQMFGAYGDHYWSIGLTVGLSLAFVVTWGALAGSMLPLLLRRVGFDPASASAPFVATLVDVSGLAIYFSVASVLLRGSLL